MTGILVSFVGGSYGAKPSNTSAPVESGTAQFGSTLSVTTGCWTGAPTPTYSYQWYRGCTVVSGATSSTRTLAACCVGFAMKAKVTATNAIGCASAFSNSSSTVSALVPNAPTSVSASATSCSSISVSFTGSTCNGGASIDYYQVVCTSTGSHSTTGSSSQYQ